MSKKKWTADLVKVEAKRLTGEDDSVEDQALLASAIVGPNVRAICHFLGLRRDETAVAMAGRRLRANGIWKGSRIYHSGWFNKDGGMAFCLDVCVAQGLMERSK